ncbi:MAG: DUF2071 domain-containing protein [Phycisphaerales bacterium]
MKRAFLRAEWRDLILANYAVDPALLASRLPPGLEPDLFEGDAVYSLVGFRFLKTRVLGVKWPGFVNFPEINLRFYVREPESGAGAWCSCANWSGAVSWRRWRVVCTTSRTRRRGSPIGLSSATANVSSNISSRSVMRKDG